MKVGQLTPLFSFLTGSSLSSRTVYDRTTGAIFLIVFFHAERNHLPATTDPAARGLRLKLIIAKWAGQHFLTFNGLVLQDNCFGNHIPFDADDNLGKGNLFVRAFDRFF